MTDEEKVKRDIKTVWDSFDLERKQRATLIKPSELVESAERIETLGRQLGELAKEWAVFHPD